MITERGVTRPGVFLDEPEKPIFSDIKDRAKNSPAVVAKWAEKKDLALRPIPAGVDQWGKPTVQFGLSDPKALANYERTLKPMETVKTHDKPDPKKSSEWSPPTAFTKAVKDPSKPLDESWIHTTPTQDTKNLDVTWLEGNGLKPVEDIPSMNSGQDLLAHAVAPVIRATQVVNDGNTRVNNARIWMADDPYSDKDEQVFEYTTPKGNTFNTKQIKTYYRLGGGEVVEAQYMADPQINSFQVVDENYKGSFQPVLGRDGQYRVPVDIKLSNEQVVPIEDFQAAEISHYGFDDGTITQYADGKVPESMRDPHVRQIEGNKVMGMNVGPASPRAPWQDTSGKNMWEDDYDPEQKATNEAGAWMADLFLGSAPYMIPIPGVGQAYAIASGASRALPAMYGYDPDTYMPTGRGFENISELGQGRYEDKRLTNGQRTGKTLSPMIDQWAERASGDITGGGAEYLAKKFPKFAASKAGKFFVDNPLGRMASAFLTEGAEEAFVSPFDQLGQDSLAGLGVDKTWNEQTNKYEYRTDQSVSDRVKNVGKGMLEDGLAGSTMGLTLGGAKEIKNAKKNMRLRRKPKDRWQEPGAAPRLSQHEMQLLMEEER